jgi:hypothetical protein
MFDYYIRVSQFKQIIRFLNFGIKFTSISCKILIGLAAASDKVYQLFAHDRWFSPGTPASSTTKTGRHDIAEILLKVALSTKNQINQSKSYS